MRVVLTILLVCASIGAAAQRSGGQPTAPSPGTATTRGPLPDLPHWITDYQRAPAETAQQLRLLSTNDARSLRDALVSHSKRVDVMKVPGVSDVALMQSALAVELEAARFESPEWWQADGHEIGRFSVAASAALMEKRKTLDDAAHAWWRVAIMLTEGNHDSYGLVPPRMGSHQARRFDLATWASELFPTDTWFKLAEARGYQLRFGALLEIESPQEGRAQRSSGKWSNPTVLGDASWGQTAAAKLGVPALQSLISNPQYGDEARMRLGYVYWAMGELDRAREAETLIVAGNGPTHVRYIAAFLLGQMEQTQGHIAAATDAFGVAQRLYPSAQSASFALASLLYRDGRVTEAEQLFAAALPGPTGAVDPWRRFAEGDLPQLPVALAALREAIRR